MRTRVHPFLPLAALAALSAVAFASHAEEVDFVLQIKPLFEATCINCHNEEKAEGKYRMDTKEFAFAGGDSYPEETIVPGDPEMSAVYWMTTEPETSPDIMPPKNPLTAAQQELIKAWIEQGAEWPEGVVLEEKPRMSFENHILPLLIKGGPFTSHEQYLLRLWVSQGAIWPEGFTIADVEEFEGPADDLELVEAIRGKILETTTVTSEEAMEEYTNAIPRTGVAYEMVPIPGGTFLMGSPENESGRLEDEGPQHEVEISPFWMGKFEVTWNQYEPFMISGIARNKDGSPVTLPENPELADIVSSPTNPYTEMSFGMGTDGYPAICMTEHAANKFCQWLSAQTGHYYRLPTEAEWEYAARAGTTGPYSCPTDELADYAIMDPDQVRVGYEKVGTRKPNPWGLYDMHGNVMEWVLDQYVADAYRKRSGVTKNPFEIPTTLYPRVARGGAWLDPPEDLRSARRFASEENWKQEDPQLPKSIWYHTDAHWLGFRIVRPLKVPEAEEMHLYWNIGVLD